MALDNGGSVDPFNRLIQDKIAVLKIMFNIVIEFGPNPVQIDEFKDIGIIYQIKDIIESIIEHFLFEINRDKEIEIIHLGP